MKGRIFIIVVERLKPPLFVVHLKRLGRTVGSELASQTTQNEARYQNHGVIVTEIRPYESGVGQSLYTTHD